MTNFRYFITSQRLISIFSFLVFCCWGLLGLSVGPLGPFNLGQHCSYLAQTPRVPSRLPCVPPRPGGRSTATYIITCKSAKGKIWQSPSPLFAPGLAWTLCMGSLRKPVDLTFQAAPCPLILAPLLASVGPLLARVGGGATNFR